MPYIKETCIAGTVIEVTKRHSTRYGKKGIKRGKNVKKTSEAMKRVNERASIVWLRRLINANFLPKDIHLMLTYKREIAPTPEEAQEDLKRFLRKLRTYFKRQGKKLKYITVTEYKRKRIHHHLIINSMDTRDIVDMWKKGHPNFKYLYEEGQYAQLAEYFVKETRETFNDVDSVVKKRWNGSKNLVKPIIKKEVVSSNSWREEPKAIKGYYLEKASIVNGVHEETGYGFQYYSMIKIDYDSKAKSG
jgi:hypothetical protein